MRITDIKQQVKRSDRYSVYIDNKYTCSFSPSELLRLGLRINQELSETDLEALKNDAIQDKAYDRAINLLSRRARSEWELRDYLKRKDYPTEVTDHTIERLQERGYVDDLDFAQRWIDNRRLLKPTSKRRLIQELRQKHIASDVIDLVLESDDADEKDVLRELVARKHNRYPNQLKFMRYLAGQGYNYDDIKSVLDDLDQQ